MKRWSRKEQASKFLKKDKRLNKIELQKKEKEFFYLEKLSAAENAACSDAIEVNEYSPQNLAE